MADGKVVKIIEIVGESPSGWDGAIKQVIDEAQKSLRGITRIGVEEFDVRMKDDKIEVFRVRAKVSFRIEK
jgi:flavin-binding protein dodecin